MNPKNTTNRAIQIANRLAIDAEAAKSITRKEYARGTSVGDGFGKEAQKIGVVFKRSGRKSPRRTEENNDPASPQPRPQLPESVPIPHVVSAKVEPSAQLTGILDPLQPCASAEYSGGSPVTPNPSIFEPSTAASRGGGLPGELPEVLSTHNEAEAANDSHETERSLTSNREPDKQSSSEAESTSNVSSKPRQTRNERMRAKVDKHLVVVEEKAASTESHRHDRDTREARRLGTRSAKLVIDEKVLEAQLGPQLTKRLLAATRQAFNGTDVQAHDANHARLLKVFQIVTADKRYPSNLRGQLRKAAVSRRAELNETAG